MERSEYSEIPVEIAIKLVLPPGFPVMSEIQSFSLLFATVTRIIIPYAVAARADRPSWRSLLQLSIDVANTREAS